MAGHRPFRDLVADRMKDWSPERRAQYEARKAQFEAEMAATAELTGPAATRAAIEELAAGKGARFPSVESLMQELHDGACSAAHRGNDCGAFTVAFQGHHIGWCGNHHGHNA